MKRAAGWNHHTSMPDFKKPSDESKPLPPNLGTPATTISIGASPTKAHLNCGEDFTVNASAAQILATCNQADFNSLYDLVEALVDEALSGVTCVSKEPAETCSKETHILGQSWNCKANAAGESVATVDLSKRAYCAKKPIQHPFPQRPSATDLRSPGQAGQIATPGDSTVIDHFQVPECGGAGLLIHLTYSELLKCKATENFKPQVDAAIQRAQRFGDNVKCSGVCIPRVEIEQYSWNCENDRMTVDVYFRLFCVRPRAPEKQ